MSVIEKFMEIVKNKAPFQAKNIESYMEAMCDEEVRKLERRIRFFMGGGETVESLVEAYLAFIDYFIEERRYFVEYGTYRYQSFEEAKHLYSDVNYMKNYMIGLCLSIYLWKIQRDNMRFFVESCRKHGDCRGTYLEIGPGHGEYFAAAIENTNYDNYIGVDISKTSAEMTDKYMKYVLGDGDKQYEVINKDFFEYSMGEEFQAIVMGEILEHVEEPLKFLKRIYQVSNKDTFIYVSTAINSPYPDHIYHFHNIEEVYELFEQANLEVLSEICTVADSMKLERAVAKNYDIVVGFVLRRK